MANTNFENFFNHIWDNNIDLIEADFYLKILTAILYLGRHQISRGDDKITFNFYQIRELLNLDDSVSINQQIKRAIFQLYFKPFKYYKLINNCSWYLRVIRGLLPQINLLKYLPIRCCVEMEHLYQRTSGTNQ